MMDVAQLEESLSRPSACAVNALRTLTGDLVVLGAGGKMGPSLARMAQRALSEAGSAHSVIAVARYTNAALREELEQAGVRTLARDLLDREAVRGLPDAGGVVFMAGAKCGTRGDASTTWAVNALMPGLVAERYVGVPTVVFSSGNVYPFMKVGSGGATEETPVDPVGEYAWSVVARERVFEHFARTRGTPVAIYRLNYAAELRYGVPVDIALRVQGGEPIDLTTGYVNVIWQGDANAMALACFGIATAPPRVLNVTGPETISVRELALGFGERLGRAPVFTGVEGETALLSNAARACKKFGAPRVTLDELVDLVADWVRAGGATHAKPTQFEVRDGAF